MKKVILLVTICSFIAAGIGFLTNVILARHFSYDIYGRINLLLSLNTILLIFLQFGFQNALVIFFNKKESKDKSNDSDLSKIFFVNRQYYKYLLYIGIPIVLVFTLVSDYLYALSVNEKIFIVCTPFLLGVYTYYSTYYQALGEWLKFNILNVLYSLLKAIILLGAFCSIYYIFDLDFTYDDYVFSFISYSVILFLIGLFVSKRYIKTGSKNEQWKNALNKIVIPIGASNLLVILIMRVDNILIEHYLGIKEVAIYSAANSLAFVFPLFTGAIMKVLMKEVSKDSITYLYKILHYQKKYFVYLLISIVGVYFLSPYIIPLIFGDKYTHSIIIFQILSVVYIGGIFFTPLESYFYTENPKQIFILKIFQLLIIFLVGSLLLNMFSLIGMAFAIVLSRLFAWGYLYIRSNKIINTNTEQ